MGGVLLVDMDSTRICPGRYFADISIWLMMSNILATFDIGPPVDASGKPQVVGEVKYTAGLVRSVPTFQRCQW